MKKFTGMLLDRKGASHAACVHTPSTDETTGDVVDLLLGLSDFVEFKSMMLAYKKGESLDFEVSNDPVQAAAHK